VILTKKNGAGPRKRKANAIKTLPKMVTTVGDRNQSQASKKYGKILNN